VKIKRSEIIKIINKIIEEQFTIPVHSKHSDFPMFSESDVEDEDGEDIDEQGFVSPAASLQADGDDARAMQGGFPVYQYDEAEER